MAWSSPKTWTAEDAVTAGEMNREVRDNLRELSLEKISNSGQYLISSGANEVEMRSAEQNQLDAVITTTSGTPVASTGPAVIVTHGGGMLIFFSARMRRLSGTGIMNCAPEIDGVTAGAANLATSIRTQSTAFERFSGHVLHYDLPPGTHTVRLMYWIDSGEAEYANRNICVWPL